MRASLSDKSDLRHFPPSGYQTLVSPKYCVFRIPKDNFPKNYFHTFFFLNKESTSVFVYKCCCWECFSYSKTGEGSMHIIWCTTNEKLRLCNDELKRLFDLLKAQQLRGGCQNLERSRKKKAHRDTIFNHHITFIFFAIFCAVLNEFTIKRDLFFLLSLFVFFFFYNQKGRQNKRRRAKHQHTQKLGHMLKCIVVIND